MLAGRSQREWQEFAHLIDYRAFKLHPAFADTFSFVYLVAWR